MDYASRSDIKALKTLCYQLIKDQQHLKKRLEKQEFLIKSLDPSQKKPLFHQLFQQPNQSKRSSSQTRKPPSCIPISPEQNGFFTFRPSESLKSKTKFPREIFSRKCRSRADI